MVLNRVSCWVVSEFSCGRVSPKPASRRQRQSFTRPANFSNRWFRRNLLPGVSDAGPHKLGHILLLTSCQIPRATGTSPVRFALANFSRAASIELASKLTIGRIPSKQLAGCRSAACGASQRSVAMRTRRPRISRRERLAGCEEPAEDARRSVRRGARFQRARDGHVENMPHVVTPSFWESA